MSRIDLENLKLAKRLVSLNSAIPSRSELSKANYEHKKLEKDLRSSGSIDMAN